MKLELADSLSASLAQPLQSAAQAANGAQFALMLSLVFEAKIGDRIGFSETGGSVNEATVAASFAPVRIEHSLARALDSGNAAAFNLYNCLYRECPIGAEPAVDKPAQAEVFPPAFDRRGRGEEMLKQIEKSKQQASYMSGA